MEKKIWKKMMKKDEVVEYQYETISYYVKDALEELGKVLKGCEERTLKDGELLPLMEHSLHMLNAAFNLRYTSKKVIADMSQEEWEKHTFPPRDIFK